MRTHSIGQPEAFGSASATSGYTLAIARGDMFSDLNDVTASALVEVTDLLRFEGTGAATLRVAYEISRDGMDRDVDEYLTIGNTTTAPVFVTADEHRMLTTDFVIALGQDVPYAIRIVS